MSLVESPLRALLGVLLACAALSSCLAAPTPEDWLAVGSRTPRQTFRTFQTGLRADDPSLEYRCFSGGFKKRTGVTELTYREYRRELFRQAPWLRWAASAKVRKETVLAPDRVRLRAEVSTWLHDETFEVDLVREDFYEFWVDGKRADDDAVPWSELAREDDGELVVRVPLGDLGWEDVGQLVAGREWKIDGFPGVTDDAGQPQP